MGWWEAHEVKKGKCEVLHLWWNDPMQQAGANWMKFGFAEEDLRLLVDKLNMSQQHALIIKKTSQILGCIITHLVSRSKKFSLFGTCKNWQYCVYRFRLSSSRKTLMYLSKVSGCLPTWSGGWHMWIMKIVLNELDLFGQGKISWREAIYRCLTGGYEEDRTKCLEVCNDMTRVNRHKLQHEKFCLYIWKKNHSEGNQTLEQAAHRVSGIFILGSI